MAGKRTAYVGPIRIYVITGLLYVLARAASPLITTEDLLAIGFRAAEPTVEIFPEMSVASIGSLPPESKVAFFWDYYSDKDPPFYISRAATTVAGPDGRAAVAIPHLNGLGPSWVTADWHGMDYRFDRQSQTWTYQLHWTNNIEWAMDDLAGGLLIAIPFFAFLVWIVGFSRRRPFLECLAFSTYFGSVFNFLLLPLVLFLGEEVAFGIHSLMLFEVLITLCLWLRAFMDFMEIKFAAAAWRVLLVLLLIVCAGGAFFAALEAWRPVANITALKTEVPALP